MEMKEKIGKESWTEELYERVKQETSETSMTQFEDSESFWSDKKNKTEIICYENKEQDLVEEESWPKETELAKNDGPFLCLWCDHIFSLSEDREEHVKLCHEQEYDKARKNKQTHNNATYQNSGELTSQPLLTSPSCLGLNAMRTTSHTEIDYTGELMKVSKLDPLWVKKEELQYEAASQVYNNPTFKEINGRKSATLPGSLMMNLTERNEEAEQSHKYLQRQESDSNETHDNGLNCSTIYLVFKCETCYKMYQVKKCLPNHIAFLSGNPSSKCQVCSKKNGTKFNLNEHIHSSFQSLNCEVCNKTFLSKDFLTKHKKLHWSNPPFICDICGKIFHTRSVLIKHTNFHLLDRPYGCEVCSKKFVTSSHLKAHRAIHQSDRPFSCNLCNKKSVSNAHLTIHIKSHSSYRLFKCNVCNCTFKTKELLNNHKMIQCPFRCDLCNKTFATKANISCHLRNHAPDRPFKCKVCSKTFLFNSSLIRHRKIRPFKCRSLGTEKLTHQII